MRMRWSDCLDRQGIFRREIGTETIAGHFGGTVDAGKAVPDVAQRMCCICSGIRRNDSNDDLPIAGAAT